MKNWRWPELITIAIIAFVVWALATGKIDISKIDFGAKYKDAEFRLNTK